jgi:hypothetical protein
MKTINLKLPTTWDELTEKQYLRIIKALHQELTPVQTYLSIFMILVNARWFQFKKKANAFIVRQQVPLSELINHFDFIFKTNNRTIFPSAFKTKSGTLVHPPMNRIVNLSADEFAVCDDLHNQFRQTKNPEFLHYLAAALYVDHPTTRPPFDKNHLSFRHLDFKDVPLEKLLAIEIAWFGCKNHLRKRFPQVFPETQNPKKLRKKYGFGKVILQMCRGDLSKRQTIGATNIYTFLEQFETDIKNSNS